MPPRLCRFAVMVSDMDALLRTGVEAPIGAPRDAKHRKSATPPPIWGSRRRHVRAKPLSRSLRGSAAGREPGTHNHGQRMDSGLASASLRRPGMTGLTKETANNKCYDYGGRGLMV